ncbi:LuxR C-terminal-related transcriptional regulator [Bartonella sp. LJL80]
MGGKNIYDTDTPKVSFESVFKCLPIACAVLNYRSVYAYNDQFSELWECGDTDLRNRSFDAFYASQEDFSAVAITVAPILSQKGHYTHDKLLRKYTGKAFWCRVSGTSLHRDDPYKWVIWIFQDLKDDGIHSTFKELTNREKDVARLLFDGLSSKEIAIKLGISYRTIDVYRLNLLRKFRVKTTQDLLDLLNRQPLLNRS